VIEAEAELFPGVLSFSPVRLAVLLSVPQFVAEVVPTTVTAWLAPAARVANVQLRLLPPVIEQPLPLDDSSR